MCNEIGNVVLLLLQCTTGAYIHTCPVVYTRTYIRSWSKFSVVWRIIHVHCV